MRVVSENRGDIEYRRRTVAAADIFVPEHVIVKFINVRIVRNDLMVLTYAVNSQKMLHQLYIGFPAFYKDKDLSLSVIH